MTETHLNRLNYTVKELELWCPDGKRKENRKKKIERDKT